MMQDDFLTGCANKTIIIKAARTQNSSEGGESDSSKVTFIKMVEVANVMNIIISLHRMQTTN